MNDLERDIYNMTAYKLARYYGGIEKDASVLGTLGALGATTLHSMATNPLMWIGSTAAILGTSKLRNMSMTKMQNDMANANRLAEQQSNYIKKLESGLIPGTDYIKRLESSIASATKNQLTPLQIGSAAALGASIPVVAGKIHDYFKNRNRED